MAAHILSMLATLGRLALHSKYRINVIKYFVFPVHLRQGRVFCNYLVISSELFLLL